MEKCAVQRCASLQYTPQRRTKHALNFQNGGRMERNQTMFVQFNIKYRGQAWLPNDDTSTGRQRNSLVAIMLSAFLIWLFSLHSDSRHSVVYVKQRCRSWSGKLINFSLPVDCYVLLLLFLVVLINPLIYLITFWKHKPLNRSSPSILPMCIFQQQHFSSPDED